MSEFTVKDREYVVNEPTFDQYNEADKIEKRTFNQELLENGLLRQQVDVELKKRGLWSDEQEQEFRTLSTELNDSEFRLESGGIKLTNAKELALDMRVNRGRMVDMLTSRANLDSATCEGIAADKRFKYLLIQCLVYKDSGESCFQDIFQLDRPENFAVVNKGSEELFSVLNGSHNTDESLPENKFLKKYGFVNDELSLIDKDGRLIDRNDKHINEYGKFIKWTSEKTSILVDIDGREIDKDGNFVVDFVLFLDEEGSPIEEEKEKEKPKRRTSKKVSAAS
jgi:hypothetical protein